MILDEKWKLLVNGEEKAKHDWNQTVISGDIVVWKLELQQLCVIVLKHQNQHSILPSTPFNLPLIKLNFKIKFQLHLIIFISYEN